MDCDDGNDETIDTCSLGVCSNVDSCAGVDCDDGNDDTIDTCSLGECSNVVSCAPVNGIRWCQNPDLGLGSFEQSCNNVCASLGLFPVLDHVGVLNAQNTLEKCQLLANVFGGSVDLGNYGTCVERVYSSLFCSTFSNCPANILTRGYGGTSLSICPCDDVPQF